MIRYLYKSQGQLSKFVRKQYKRYKHEEAGYNSAILSQSRNKAIKLIQEDKMIDQEEIMQELYP